MRTDIVLSATDRVLFRRELAGTYYTSAEADPVLDMVGYRRGRRPNIDALRPEVAWNEIFADFDSGIVAEPYRNLLAAVLDDRPANAVFVDLAGRYGVGVSSVPYPRSSPGNGASATTRPTGGGHGSPAGRTKVFLCYSAPDRDAVAWLYRSLRADGYVPWLDEEDVAGGQNRDFETRRALRSSHFVVACLSTDSVSRAGKLYRYLQLALDIADEQPEGAAYLIPVRLDEVEVPDRLVDLEPVDMFVPGGYDKLRRALRDAPSR